MQQGDGGQGQQHGVGGHLDHVLLQTYLCIMSSYPPPAGRGSWPPASTPDRVKASSWAREVLLYSGSYCLVLLFLTFAVISFVTISILS